jgi:hypothetical protein
MMNLYRVIYFDNVQWGWMDRRFLAVSVEQVIDCINEETPESCRYKPYAYRGKDEPEVDSLEISVLINDIKLPCDFDDIDIWM